MYRIFYHAQYGKDFQIIYSHQLRTLFIGACIDENPQRNQINS